MEKLKKNIEDLEAKIRAKRAEIDGKKAEIEWFEPSDHIGHDQYDEMLDDCYPEVECAGFTCSPSNALKKLDPIAYRCGYADYCADYDLDMIPEYDALTEDLDLLESELEDLEGELEEVEEELDDINAARESAAWAEFPDEYIVRVPEAYPYDYGRRFTELEDAGDALRAIFGQVQRDAKRGARIEYDGDHTEFNVYDDDNATMASDLVGAYRIDMVDRSALRERYIEACY